MTQQLAPETFTIEDTVAQVGSAKRRPLRLNILRTSANLFGIFAIIGTIAMLAGEIHEDYHAPEYIIGENFLFVSAILACIFSLAFRWSLRSLSPIGRKPALQAIGVGLLATLAVVMVELGFQGKLAVISITFAMSLGMGTGLLVYQMIAPRNRRTRTVTLAAYQAYMIFVLLGLSLLIGYAIRWLLPGSNLAVWVITPIDILIAPGMGIGLALLPVNTGWVERLIISPPLSLAIQLITLMWLIQLGLPITLTVYMLVPLISIMLGLGMTAWRYTSQG